MTEAKIRSLWLDELGNTVQPLPEFQGTTRADIAIAGGGYVGLWTAINIKQSQPSCDVVLLEADICGGGASGRNGGFVLSWASKLCTLSKLFGSADALQIVSDSMSAINELATFAVQHRIDADFRNGGWLWSATSKAQIGAWESVLQLCERQGFSPFHRLEPKEVKEIPGSDAHLAGVYDSRAAIIQPAFLVRGLRRVALELGVRIFEHTEMLGFTRSSPVIVRCEKGTIKADKLVLATNGWAANIRELSRSVVVISSDMIATEPIPDLLEKIGWLRDLPNYRFADDGRLLPDYEGRTRRIRQRGMDDRLWRSYRERFRP